MNNEHVNNPLFTLSFAKATDDKKVTSLRLDYSGLRHGTAKGRRTIEVNILIRMLECSMFDIRLPLLPDLRTRINDL